VCVCVCVCVCVYGTCIASYVHNNTERHRTYRDVVVVFITIFKGNR